MVPSLPDQCPTYHPSPLLSLLLIILINQPWQLMIHHGYIVPPEPRGVAKDVAATGASRLGAAFGGVFLPEPGRPQRHGSNATAAEGRKGYSHHRIETLVGMMTPMGILWWRTKIILGMMKPATSSCGWLSLVYPNICYCQPLLLMNSDCFLHAKKKRNNTALKSFTPWYDQILRSNEGMENWIVNGPGGVEPSNQCASSLEKSSKTTPHPLGQLPNSWQSKDSYQLAPKWLVYS